MSPYRTTIRASGRKRSTLRRRFAERRETAGTRLCPCFGLTQSRNAFDTCLEGSPGRCCKVSYDDRSEEGDYWKIIAIRIEDSSDAGLVPNNAAAQTEPSVGEPRSIAGDSAAVKDITEFYQTWIVKRNVTEASRFASRRSYQCDSSYQSRTLRSVLRLLFLRA